MRWLTIRDRLSPVIRRMIRLGTVPLTLYRFLQDGLHDKIGTIPLPLALSS